MGENSKNAKVGVGGWRSIKILALLAVYVKNFARGAKFLRAGHRMGGAGRATDLRKFSQMGRWSVVGVTGRRPGLAMLAVER